MIRLAKIAAVGLCFGYVVALLVRNFDELRSLDVTWHPLPALLSFPLALAYLGGRAWIWHRISAQLIGPFGLRTDALSWLASLLGKYLPGKVFLLLGRVTLYRDRGAPAAQVTLAFAAEAACDALSALVVFGLWLAVGDPDLPVGLQAALAGLFVGLVIATHPAIFQRVARAVLHVGGQASAPFALRWRDMGAWTLALTGNWLVLGAGFALLLRSWIDVPPETFLAAMGAFAVAGVAGSLALFAPSGIGVREGVLTFLLAGALGPGVAAAAALGARIWLTAAEALAAGAALWVVRSDRADSPPLNPAEPRTSSSRGGEAD